MATTEADIVAREAARPTAPPVVEFRRVSKRYDNGMGLDDASFTVGRGEFVFLVGSTGSGKSTVMRLLIKELEPTSGTIRVAGRDLAEITRKKVPFFRRNLGVVFQDFKLLPNRTVHDNVAYALQVTGSSRKEVRAKVPDILRLTGLSTKLHHFPDQLSGGEQQRVSVARAFVNHPPLLLADEPTGNLDPETSIGIMQLLYRINRTGTTVIVATHDSAMVDRMRRRVIELSQRAHHPRRGLGPLRAARHVDRRVRRAAARARAGAPARPRAGRRVRRGVPRLMRIGFFLREALRSMSRNAVPSFAAMASVLVTVLVLGVFIPVVQATTGAANDVRSRVLVNVYLKTDAKRDDVARVQRLLDDKVAHVGKVQYLSKADALAEQKARYPEAYDLLGSNPLPDTFRVTPDKPDNALKLRDALSPSAPGGGRTTIDPAIDTVKNSKDDTQKILVATRVVKLTTGLLAVLLIVASVLLVSNTIRLSLFSRRREVEVMKLVGATDWFIRWPFVIEGIVLGALGGLMAILLLLVGKIALLDPLISQFALLAAPKTIHLGVLVAVLLAASIGVSAAGSGLSLRRFLRV